MADMENVIKGLQCIEKQGKHGIPCHECPYYNEYECNDVIARDAIELLKEIEDEVKTLSVFARADGIDVDALLERKVKQDG